MRATSVKARRPVVDIIGRIADTLWMSSFRACSVLDSSPFIALILSCRSSFSFSWIRVSSSWFWRAFLSSGKNMYTLVLCAVIPTCVSLGWPKHFVTFYCRVTDTPRPISTSQFLKTANHKQKLLFMWLFGCDKPTEHWRICPHCTWVTLAFTVLLFDLLHKLLAFLL